MVAAEEIITTEQDAEEVSSGTKLSDLQADVKLIIHNPKTQERLAYGPGVAELCIGVKKYGSLKAAATEMGMAYSKAWKIVGEAEDALDLKLVIRQPPKGYKLTEEAEELLQGYLDITEDLSKYAEFRYQRTFPDKDEEETSN